MNDYNYILITSEGFNSIYKVWKNDRKLTNNDMSEVWLAVKDYKANNTDWQPEEMLFEVFGRLGVQYEIIEPDFVISI